LLELLLLFGSQDFFHPRANIGIQVVDLLLLFIREIQAIAGKRRQHRGGPPPAATTWTRARSPIILRAAGSPTPFLPVTTWPVTTRTITPRSFTTSSVTTRTFTTRTIASWSAGACVARSGAVSSATGRSSGAALRMQLVFGQLSIAVLIELLKRFAGGLDLFGREYAVMVLVECFEHGTRRRRRSALAVPTVRPASAPWPAWRLRPCHRGPAHRETGGQQQTDTQQSPNKASHDRFLLKYCQWNS
jgi:hypothetical protein